MESEYSRIMRSTTLSTAWRAAFGLPIPRGQGAVSLIDICDDIMKAITYKKERKKNRPFSAPAALPAPTDNRDSMEAADVPAAGPGNSREAATEAHTVQDAPEGAVQSVTVDDNDVIDVIGYNPTEHRRDRNRRRLSLIPEESENLDSFVETCESAMKWWASGEEQALPPSPPARTPAPSQPSGEEQASSPSPLARTSAPIQPSGEEQASSPSPPVRTPATSQPSGEEQASSPSPLARTPAPIQPSGEEQASSPTPPARTSYHILPTGVPREADHLRAKTSKILITLVDPESIDRPKSEVIEERIESFRPKKLKRISESVPKLWEAGEEQASSPLPLARTPSHIQLSDKEQVSSLPPLACTPALILPSGEERESSPSPPTRTPAPIQPSGEEKASSPLPPARTPASIQPSGEEKASSPSPPTRTPAPIQPSGEEKASSPLPPARTPASIQPSGEEKASSPLPPARTPASIQPSGEEKASSPLPPARTPASIQPSGEEKASSPLPPARTPSHIQLSDKEQVSSLPPLARTPASIQPSGEEKASSPSPPTRTPAPIQPSGEEKASSPLPPVRTPSHIQPSGEELPSSSSPPVRAPSAILPAGVPRKANHLRAKTSKRVRTPVEPENTDRPENEVIDERIESSRPKQRKRIGQCPWSTRLQMSLSKCATMITEEGRIHKQRVDSLLETMEDVRTLDQEMRAAHYPRCRHEFHNRSESSVHDTTDNNEGSRAAEAVGRQTDSDHSCRSIVVLRDNESAPSRALIEADVEMETTVHDMTEKNEGSREAVAVGRQTDSDHSCHSSIVYVLSDNESAQNKAFIEIDMDMEMSEREE